MEETIQALLTVDCGTTVTRVALLERGEDRYRPTAQATAGSTCCPPWRDVMVGVLEAVRRIESATGRRLLNGDDSPLMPASDGEGVDAVTVVVSAAEPLRVALAGLTRDVGLAAARRALAAAHAVIVHQIALDAGAVHDDVARLIADLQEARPDLLLLTGGLDGGARDPVLNLAHVLSLALRAIPTSLRPHVLYAGNSDLRPHIAPLFGDITDFKSLDNLIPTLDRQNLTPLQMELDILYHDCCLKRLPGFDRLEKWAANRVVSTAKSFAQSVYFLSRNYGIRVLGADVGSAGTTLAAGDPRGLQAMTRVEIGTGCGLPALLRQTDAQAVCRWLPFDLSPAEAWNTLHNKSIYPHTIPQTVQDVHLELAVAREILGRAWAEAGHIWGKTGDSGRVPRQWDLVVGGGQVLTNLPNLSLAALALLDGLQQSGVYSLALDAKGLLGTLGGAATVSPLAAAQVAGYDSLLELGVVIAPLGVARPGKTALKLKITFDDEREISNISIPAGVLQLIPLQADEKATLEIRPRRPFSLHPPGGAGSGVIAEVNGGALGIIIDTRGRPLLLPEEGEARRRQIQEWLTQMGAPFDAPGAPDAAPPSEQSDES